MLNHIWAFLILIGIAVAAFTGNIESISNSIIDSAGDAINLLILMAGVVSMWSGFLSVAEESGLTKFLAKKMKPLLRFLFPNLPTDHPAADYISANFIANILGLGWACTPTGIEAMKALKSLESIRRTRTKNAKSDHIQNNQSTCNDQLSHPVNTDTASDEMCTFLILNISSLQLIPMNLIAYRTRYGSPAPMAVIAPGLITTSITTIFAVIICRLLVRKHRPL